MGRWRVLLLAVLAISTAGAISTSASAQTTGDVIQTTDLIGILGGINLPQVNVPQDIDPEAAQPGDQGTTAPQNTAPQTTAPQQEPVSHPPSYYCRGASKHRANGRRRTPFSQCVIAISKLSSGSETSPATACRGLSHKRASNRKSPFAICVAGGKQLLLDKS